MIKLMKLEMRKYKIGGFIKGAIITNLVMASLLLAASIIAYKTGDEAFRNISDIFYVTDVAVKCIFTIFSGVLISRFVIDEYSNKTINLMFMYPISRKKIMLAKLLVIVLFTFTAMILSNIFMSSIIYSVNAFQNYIDTSFTINMIINNMINVIINSLYYSFLSLMPLYVGMKKRTSSSVITSSIILTSVLNSGGKYNGNEFRLGSIGIIPCILAIIGVIVVYICIKDVENSDVTN